AGLMYRFQRIAQILRLIPPPIPPLRRPWPTLASPVSLYILSQAQTARLGRIAIAIPQRSILIKSKKLRLCSSPHAFPTIQSGNPTIGDQALWGWIVEA
ncbi:Lactaldehyde dehydrogenase, partial [Fusarium oxysporum f. sp. albedinis]